MYLSRRDNDEVRLATNLSRTVMACYWARAEAWLRHLVHYQIAISARVSTVLDTILHRIEGFLTSQSHYKAFWDQVY